MCDEPLVRLPIMEFVHAVHLSHIQESNQRCLEPAIFCCEVYQVIKMTVNTGWFAGRKKMPEKSYVRNFRRDWVQNVEGLYCTIPTVPQCLSLRPNWLPSTPSSPSECIPPWNQMGGGVTLACGRGGGGTQFGRLERKPGTLYTLGFNTNYEETFHPNKEMHKW